MNWFTRLTHKFGWDRCSCGSWVRFEYPEQYTICDRCLWEAMCVGECRVCGQKVEYPLRDLCPGCDPYEDLNRYCGCGRSLDEDEGRRCEQCEEIEATAGEQQDLLLQDRACGGPADDLYIVHYQGRDYLLPHIDRDCVLAVEYDHRKFPEMLPESMMQDAIEGIIRRSYPTLFPDTGN